MIPKTDIQKWWIWAYWISPLMYADNAAFVNEFKADRWAKVGYQTNPFFPINPIPFLHSMIPQLGNKSVHAWSLISVV